MTEPPSAADERKVPCTRVHRLVRRFIEPAQDALVTLLTVALLGLMARGLFTLALPALVVGDPHANDVEQALVPGSGPDGIVLHIIPVPE